MTPADRRRTIKAMPVSPDRYYAAYCHEVVSHIELHGHYGGLSRYACKQFRDGIKRFFSIETNDSEAPDGLKITFKTSVK